MSREIKMTVFLSHIHEESDLATALKAFIENAFLGMVNVFVSSDSQSIRPGNQWLKVVTDALNSCSLQLILCSPTSIKRPWVNFEAGAAWIRGIQVIPLCHSGLDRDRLPNPLSALQSVNLLNPAGFQTVISEIAQALRVRTPGGDVATFLDEIRKIEVALLRAPLETARRLNDTPEQGAVGSGIIVAPKDNEEVHQRIVVRGTIYALHSDLRAWLVVKTPVGDLYPQGRVTRNEPDWEREVRIGLAQWGADEGAVYEIHLVAAGPDADYQFDRYLRGEGPSRDGLGPLWPGDATILDRTCVIRRDLRHPDIAS
ncbi:MAG TPA: toll/interleukin-1 receptor domain-containing protein [Candidatus Elarobacter sp.]|nr:toll/interleukin-1 receptor domain-containing protein [Candidatus Elarobacter sp.]HEV2741045.1 toll/interleukin-1 receptor domain-containing protein [Candidatus Elarobacter sp.]